MEYVVAFCRLLLIFLFAYSATSKLRNIPAFAQDIARFELIPQRMSHVVAWGCIVGEFITVLLLAVGGTILHAGFAGASILLVLFTSAVALVLHRGLHISCGCFGAKNDHITWRTVARNIVFACCAGIGFVATQFAHFNNAALDLSTWLVLAIIATIIILLLLQFQEFARLFTINGG